MASKLVELILSADAQALIGATNQSRAAIKKLDNEFRALENSVKGVFAFVGIGLGASEIIQLADSYGQMTGKLKLATQYSGDYVDVQQQLRDSARATRSDLGSTVQLYTTLSPALKGIGLGAKESIGIITTINQAIGLSGASAQAAEAALVQLGQGFAGGALRGEELNSIMEQTPALAQAIADGLGVPRGALKQLGADGKLTADVVAKALQKMAAQVNEDFGRLPVTVSQAMTNLKNEFMVFIGASDQASGGTSALANVINEVAEGFRDGAPAVTAFSTAIKVLINGLDGSYRLLKIVGLGLAGYAAAAMAALTGDFAGAKAIWRDLGKDLTDVLMKPLLTEPKVVESQLNTARKRKQIEEQLATEVKKLEQLKAYEAGKASDNVAAKEKSNVDARIADQQRLVDAVRAAWQASLKDAETYAEAAKAKLQKATDFRDQGKTAAFNASLSGFSEEEQRAAKQQRLAELQQEGGYEASRARMAAINKDSKAYDTFAAQAEKRLKEALTLAQDIKDVTAIEDISNSLAGVQESGARLDTAKAQEAQALAKDQATTLATLQAELDKLTKEARTIEVQADVSQATLAIAGLKAQLAEIPDNTVKTVTVQTVTQSADPAVARAIADNGGSLPVFAGGGRVRGPGSATSDSILARLSDGEYVVRAAAVNHYGANLLSRINSLALPKFAGGGLVGGRIPAGAATVNLSLDGNTYRMSASDDVAAALIDAVRREALRKGRR